MIGYLRGEVIERRTVADTAVEIVVDVRGVGYRVLVSPRLGAVAGAELALSVHTHVREGAITLYGFSDSDERRAFEILITAHGVGPALALAILSVHSPDRLVEIVATESIDDLTLVPGVGRKTAMRLLVDLKSRFGDLDGPSAGAGGSGLPGGSSTPLAEVGEALAQLGYGQEEIGRGLRALPQGGTVEELLRAALRGLAPRR